jgi:hypothetical protein
MSEIPEPDDYYTYSWVMFYATTWRQLLAAVSFYEALLNDDIGALEADPDLSKLIDEAKRKDLSIYKELDRTIRIRQWMESQVEKAAPDAFDYDISISHGTVRFIKAILELYLSHLRQRRDLIASRPNISRHVLETIDSELTRLQELTQSGVFAKATPMPLLFDQLVEESKRSETGKPTAKSLSSAVSPRPVVISSIEILDPDLRGRCMDLFEVFREDGQRERLDTVLTEATRILEDRLRKLSAAPLTCTGVDLAAYAFGGGTPILVLSDVPGEQEAAHLMYRGVIGFVRNQVHHRLSGELAPERVLQILGLIDYLIALAQGAMRKPPSDGLLSA